MKNKELSIILYLLILTIYLFTLSPSVFWWDSGEAISGCYILDVSHSPGYAAYSVFGKLFTFFPVGDISFRINFLSCLGGALSTFAFYLLSFLISKNKFISFSASLFFSFSYTLWFYSVVAEVYSIYYLLGILIIYFLVILNERRDIRFFYFLFFIFCFGVFLHPYFIVFLPAIFYSLVKNSLFNFKTIIISLFLFIVSSGIDLFLPIRSAKDIALDFGNTENFLNFLKVITFSEGVSSPEIISSYSRLFLQAKVGIYFFSRQIFILCSVFSIIGFFVLLRNKKDLFLILLVLFLLPFLPFVVLNLEEVDMWNIDYVLIFSYIVFFLHFLYGIKFTFDRFKKLTTVVIVMLLVYQFFHGISINDKSNNTTAYKSGEKILSLLDNNAILLTDNISLYNLLSYFQRVEDQKKDVKLLCTAYLSLCWYFDKISKNLNINKNFLKFCRSNIKYNDMQDAKIAENIFLQNRKVPFYVLLSQNKEQEVFYNTFSKYEMEKLTEIVEFENEKIISPFISVLYRIKHTCQLCQNVKQ